MQSLWIFGDSFSTTFEIKETDNQISNWRKEYIDWKGFLPKSFSEILSDKLNIHTNNQSCGGFDNYSIFETLIDNIDIIQPNDIIIIGWSSPIRYRLVNKENKFNPLHTWWYSANEEALLKLGISQSTINEIFINRNENISLYINEINSFIKIINKALSSNTIIHWTPFYESKKNGLNVISIPLLERIEDETNLEITDAHFSERAHLLLSEYFLNIIKNLPQNKINLV